MPDGVPSRSKHRRPTKSDTVTLNFPATDIAVRSALQKITGGLHHLELDRGTLDMIELVLAEATNNIVEHAYAESKGEIQMKCIVKAPLLEFTLIDYGLPMPNHQLPKSKEHDLENGLDALPEGGFGWAMIRDLCSSVSYRRQAQSNELRLILPFVLP